MKLDITKVATKLTLFAAVLLAASVFTGSANAQSEFQGKFTLQHSARWGKIVLPAGDYRIKAPFNPDGGPTRWVIQDAKSGKTVALESSGIVDDAPKGESALLISARGHQQVIHSFRLGTQGRSYVFDRELASHRGAEEVNNTETVPVLDARK
jgi:hypothetical protein